MLDAAMRKMKADNPDLDFILVPGDLLGHGINLDLHRPPTPLQAVASYALLMKTHRDVAKLLETHFPNIPVLPTFGNNDTKYHYQPAHDSRKDKADKNKEPFYTEMIDTWFTKHTGNKNLNNLADIKATMHQGGWYRANLVPSKLTLLSFNSLQMNANNQ
jgi:hypothetical protein